MRLTEKISECVEWERVVQHTQSRDAQKVSPTHGRLASKVCEPAKEVLRTLARPGRPGDVLAWLIRKVVGGNARPLQV